MTRKLAILTLCLIPVFFLPVTQNFYDTNKWMLLAAGALSILGFWAFTLTWTKKPLHISLSAVALGFGALSLVSLIGLVVSSTNRIEALLTPLGPTTFIAFTILVLAGVSATKQEKTLLTWTLYAITGLLGLIAVYQSLGMGKLMLPQVQFLTDALWTPTGYVTTTIALFCITLSLLVPDIFGKLKKHHDYGVIALLCIMFVVITIGAAITVGRFIPKMTGMLPFGAGWSVASRMVKSPVSAIFGIGVENFLTAFTMGRPATLNTTPLALVNITTNANFFLHMFTVYGIMGIIAALLLVISIFSGINTGWMIITKCLTIAALALAAPTVTLLAAVAIIIILAAHPPQHPPKPVVIPAGIRIVAGILLALITGVSVYFLIRAYAAEIYFFRSLRATEARDGTKTYQLQIQAIEANAFISRYHATYSQTNLSIANSLADSLEESADAEKDRLLISQLIEQAVREAKTAVTLNPVSVTAWETLGLTYQTIIPVSSEAAQWALTAYEGSVKLDPSNATIYMNIGSIFVQQKQYDNAITAFQKAVSLRPSYANAYYNMANAYKLKGDTVLSADALIRAQNLVEPESTDYYKIKNALDDLSATP